MKLLYKSLLGSLLLPVLTANDQCADPNATILANYPSFVVGKCATKKGTKSCTLRCSSNSSKPVLTRKKGGNSGELNPMLICQDDGLYSLKPNKAIECQAQACYDPIALMKKMSKSSWVQLEKSQDSQIFQLNIKKSLLKKYASEFETNNGWTLVLNLKKAPEANSTFLALNGAGMSSDASGKILSLHSKPSNKNLMEAIDNKATGSSAYSIFIQFNGVTNDIEVKSVGIYFGEYSDVGCYSGGKDNNDVLVDVNGNAIKEGHSVKEIVHSSVVGVKEKVCEVCEVCQVQEETSCPSQEDSEEEPESLSVSTVPEVESEDSESQISVDSEIPEELESCQTGYQGCFEDPKVENGKPVFDMEKLVTKNMDSLEACLNECQQLGYQYAGVNRGTECFCDNSFGTHGQKPDSDCNAECVTANHCGGGFRLSVHRVACGVSDSDSTDSTSVDAESSESKSTQVNSPLTPVSPPTALDPNEMTDLERYISTKDEAYNWVENTGWNVYGDNPIEGLADYAWLTLTSQNYLDSDTVIEVNGRVGNAWTHNLIICSGEIKNNLNSDDVGMMWLNGHGKGTNLDEYPRNQGAFNKACKQAAQLGTVGVILDSVPASVLFHDETEAHDEYFQISGATRFFEGNSDVSAIAIFPEVKAVSMAMNAADEYLQSKGLRTKAITRWSVTGGSKRGAVTMAATAAEPRVAISFPVIQDVFHATADSWANDLNALGGINLGWGSHYKEGWHKWYFTPSEKRNTAWKSLNLQKYHKERITSVPMHFLLGSNDNMMHIDNINIWWDEDWSKNQLSTLHIQPNQGHSGGGSENEDPMYIMVQAICKNEYDELPHLSWSYSDENTIKACILRPTKKFSATVIRGVAENGRDFRQAKRGVGQQNNGIFTEQTNCQNDNNGGSSFTCSGHEANGIAMSGVLNEPGCYYFEDVNTLPEGKYSAMWVSVTFETDYEDIDGEKLTWVQSSGPLVRPNTYPFDLCDWSEEQCDITGLDIV